MHSEAYQFIASAAAILEDGDGLRIVEFGAHDINGSARELFPGAAAYVGVDPWPGDGVDVVCRAQDFRAAAPFDACVSAEVLEHDPDPAGQIAAAWLALKPGGALILTCAAEPRRAHRCDGMEGDLLGEHYANIGALDLMRHLDGWIVRRLVYDGVHGDLYALAVKP